MSAEAEMKILNLYNGQPIKKAVYALEVAEQFVANRTLSLRLKIVGLEVSDD